MLPVPSAGLEVAEAEPTEAEDTEKAEEGNAGSRVAIKIEIVQRTEQHHQRPEEPSRRSKQQPPDRKTTHNTLTIGICVSAADSMCPVGTPVQHAPQCAAKTAIRRDATEGASQHYATGNAWHENFWTLIAVVDVCRSEHKFGSYHE